MYIKLYHFSPFLWWGSTVSKNLKNELSVQELYFWSNSKQVLWTVGKSWFWHKSEEWKSDQYGVKGLFSSRSSKIRLNRIFSKILQKTGGGKTEE